MHYHSSMMHEMKRNNQTWVSDDVFIASWVIVNVIGYFLLGYVQIPSSVQTWDSTKRESLYIPVGCANAFLTLEDNTWIHYYMNDFFKTDSLGFRYDDPVFAINWPVKPEHMSEKDRNYPNLEVSALWNSL